MDRIAGRGQKSFLLAGVVALVLLIGSGIAYREAESALHGVRDRPVELPVPLSAIPMRIGNWVGQDVPLKTTTEDYMRTNFADDFVSRRYVNAAQGVWADVYLVYCASQPSGLLGHKPDVCFPAHGWVRDSVGSTEIATSSGRKIESLIHLFHKSGPAYMQTYVLSFYILNGHITLRESEFSGFFDRSPNIAGDPARYVAQIQISSPFEHYARLAAQDLVDVLLMFLPKTDEDK
jgi:hypothetical protein